MARAFAKEVRRSITSSLGRFLAIALMAALGCGFYAGLRMTGPDMRLAGDEYYDGTNLMDLRVVSTVGLSDTEVNAISQVEGVSGVMPAYEADVIAAIDGVQYTTRVHSLDVDAARQSSCDDGVTVRSDDDGYLNRPILEKGSWPSSSNECLLSVDTVWQSDVSVGDTVSIVEGTSDLDDTFAVREYTVSGFVRSPLYTCSTNIGSTSLGNGSLSTFIYVPGDAFADDYPYTEAFVTVDGAAGERWPDDAYQNRVSEVADRLNALAPDLAASRLDGIRADAQATLDDKRADFESEKADALAKLDDAQAALDDAKGELDSAAAQLSGSQTTIDASKRKLAEGEKSYRDGVSELAAQRSAAEEQFDAAEQQLDAAQSQYDAAMQQRGALSAQLEQAKAAGAADAVQQLEAAIAQIDAQTAGVPDQISQGSMPRRRRPRTRLLPPSRSSTRRRPSSQAGARSSPRANPSSLRAEASTTTAFPSTRTARASSRRAALTSRRSLPMPRASLPMRRPTSTTSRTPTPTCTCSTARRTSVRRASVPTRGASTR